MDGAQHVLKENDNNFHGSSMKVMRRDSIITLPVNQ